MKPLKETNDFYRLINLMARIQSFTEKTLLVLVLIVLMPFWLLPFSVFRLIREVREINEANK